MPVKEDIISGDCFYNNRGTTILSNSNRAYVHLSRLNPASKPLSITCLLPSYSSLSYSTINTMNFVHLSKKLKHRLYLYCKFYNDYIQPVAHSRLH